MEISEVTRRNIIDSITLEKVAWSGRLEEPGFLSRLYDLTAIPSTDSRFSNAAGDIWQHRVNNHDWDDDWVFHDARFGLMSGEDEFFLRFLCETLHPVVRQDTVEVDRLRQAYNLHLQKDGYEIVEMSRISDGPIFSARKIAVYDISAVKSAKQSLTQEADASYIARQITRMETAIAEDPSLAIGTAKELVETCCKTILAKRKITFDRNLDLPQLVKATAKELKLTPDDIPDHSAAVETIRRLLSNLSTITSGVAELRNKYGTGHGKVADSKGLGPKHAKLAVGAASTLAVFLFETHEERD